MIILNLAHIDNVSISPFDRKFSVHLLVLEGAPIFRSIFFKNSYLIFAILIKTTLIGAIDFSVLKIFNSAVNEFIAVEPAFIHRLPVWILQNTLSMFSSNFIDLALVMRLILVLNGFGLES